ncbi:hypothetical protein EQM14_08045 [Caproiciproducens sp. NJN-50]|uniref:hypothetical protein n=1 Tax=Acutalibacteraceae TaxID=3082771 RepID=UPI000FFE1342|nr:MULTISPECIES: hypothetical protein [Acutalibacteraceae]QAT49728.1 hypothetical protein EQM14_08045 [Caproiciproducens sp. NJN-50]
MEVKPMRYCPRCQILVKTGAACPSCGNRKLREVEANDPVLLYTADETKCGMIRAAFDEGGIPHEERMCGPGAPPSILYGKMPNSLYHIFVPYGEVERCEEILKGIGALDESGSAQKVAFENQAEEEPDLTAMSRWKRTFVRIVSAAAFLILVWAVVTMADRLIDFLKSAFH